MCPNSEQTCHTCHIKHGTWIGSGADFENMPKNDPLLPFCGDQWFAKKSHYCLEKIFRLYPAGRNPKTSWTFTQVLDERLMCYCSIESWSSVWACLWLWPLSM